MAVDKNDVIKKYQLHETDRGSAPVQIAAALAALFLLFWSVFAAAQLAAVPAPPANVAEMQRQDSSATVRELASYYAARRAATVTAP